MRCCKARFFLCPPPSSRSRAERAETAKPRRGGGGDGLLRSASPVGAGPFCASRLVPLPRSHFCRFFRCCFNPSCGPSWCLRPHHLDFSQVSSSALLLWSRSMHHPWVFDSLSSLDCLQPACHSALRLSYWSLSIVCAWTHSGRFSGLTSAAFLLTVASRALASGLPSGR